MKGSKVARYLGSFIRIKFLSPRLFDWDEHNIFIAILACKSFEHFIVWDWMRNCIISLLIFFLGCETRASLMPRRKKFLMLSHVQITLWRLSWLGWFLNKSWRSDIRSTMRQGHCWVMTIKFSNTWRMLVSFCVLLVLFRIFREPELSASCFLLQNGIIID
jgi:hypothetical protein